MTPSLQVALLEPDALARTQLALSLVRAGFVVTECADIPTLYEALDAHGSLAGHHSWIYRPLANASTCLPQ